MRGIARVILWAGIVTVLNANAEAGVSLSVAPVSGGLAGIKRADVTIQPAFEADGNGGFQRIDGFSRVVRNLSYNWTPAISTGLIVRFADDDEKLSPGIGGHFVVFDEASEVRTAPALTLHYGTSQRQIFFGLMFTATDDVRFPNGGREIVVPDENADDFVTRRTSSRINFYGGVVVGALP